MPPVAIQRLLTMTASRAVCQDCSWCATEHVTQLAQDHARHMQHRVATMHTEMAVYTPALPPLPKEADA
jgi:hypothetical protein